jgi:hypothetical protein
MVQNNPHLDITDPSEYPPPSSATFWPEIDHFDKSAEKLLEYLQEALSIELTFPERYKLHTLIVINILIQLHKGHIADLHALHFMPLNSTELNHLIFDIKNGSETFLTFILFKILTYKYYFIVNRELMESFAEEPINLLAIKSIDESHKELKYARIHTLDQTSSTDETSSSTTQDLDLDESTATNEKIEENFTGKKNETPDYIKKSKQFQFPNKLHKSTNRRNFPQKKKTSTYSTSNSSIPILSSIDLSQKVYTGTENDSTMINHPDSIIELSHNQSFNSQEGPAWNFKKKTKWKEPQDLGNTGSLPP